MMFTVPKPIQKLYPSLVWQKQDEALYLTFDDGPHPEITPKILALLDLYEVKATFFCVGDNVRKYPDTYKLILNKGHQTANHTYNHLNGWKTATQEYLNNVEEARKLINSNLFRPPYGKIKRSQIKHLKGDYQIIMWSVLTYDFSKTISPEKCYQNALKGLKPGAITVFHDSEKAAKNMLFALPGFLKAAQKKGYPFKVL